MTKAEIHELFLRVQSKLGRADLDEELVGAVIQEYVRTLRERILDGRCITIPTIGRIEVRRLPGQKGRPYRFRAKGVFAKGLSKDLKENEMSKEREENGGMEKLGVHTVPHPQEETDAKTAGAMYRCIICQRPTLLVEGQRKCSVHGTAGSER